ncbi:MAG: cellulase family glycosylhydrolase [Bryobacterales bacterium]|nr:cellulase family glycosylhydrolase [Bryobacterales bacterium]
MPRRAALWFVVFSVAAEAQLGLRPVLTAGVHVDGARMVDATGATVLLQGTEAPADLDLNYAGTMFSTIRQRWNMNMVRLPVSVDRAARDAAYLPLVREMVRRANRSELIVILSARESGANGPTVRTAAFWRGWAEAFRDEPGVLFDLFDEPGPRPSTGGWRAWRDAMQPLVDAVRGAGARQPVIAMAFEDDQLFEGFPGEARLADAQVIYGICPSNRAHASDAARDRAFGFLALQAPLLAMGWDPELDADGVECRSVPSAPAAAAELTRSHLRYFDARGISWSASAFVPGRLIFGMDAMEPTRLEQPIRCGANEPVQGIGLTVQLHQWGMRETDLIVVSAGAGAIEVAADSVAIGYAAITATPEAAETWPLPTELGGVSLRITDAAGVPRLAPLLSAGPGSINFLVAADTAPGMATVELLRRGGANLPEPAGCLLVTLVAPGLFAATMNARGPAVGIAVQPDGTQHALAECAAPLDCRTTPVLVDPGGGTLLALYGSGFRHAGGDPLLATIGGRHVHIESFGPQPGVPYNDRLVLRLGPELAGLGEEDLVFRAGDRVSNVVRVRLVF